MEPKLSANEVFLAMKAIGLRAIKAVELAQPAAGHFWQATPAEIRRAAVGLKTGDPAFGVNKKWINIAARLEALAVKIEGLPPKKARKVIFPGTPTPINFGGDMVLQGPSPEAKIQALQKIVHAYTEKAISAATLAKQTMAMDDWYLLLSFFGHSGYAHTLPDNEAIRRLLCERERLEAFALCDGYGKMTPQQLTDLQLWYDWSHVRDASPSAKAEAAAYIRKCLNRTYGNLLPAKEI